MEEKVTFHIVFVVKTSGLHAKGRRRRVCAVRSVPSVPDESASSQTEPEDGSSGEDETFFDEAALRHTNLKHSNTTSDSVNTQTCCTTVAE